MLNVGAQVKTNFSEKEIVSQANFALAKSLTLTATQGKEKILKSLNETFTIRNKWSTNGPYAIKVKPATKSNLRAEVGTNADWLLKHEDGGDKTPKGNDLAIPTVNVRRTKRDLIQKAQRPGALRGKGDVVIAFKSGKGKGLFVRRGRGKNKQLVLLYVLEPKARIKKQSTVLEPAQKTYQRQFNVNFAHCFADALATAKAKPVK